MAYDPERHHRRSIRLQGYDYGQAGLYYVTFVTRDRECLLGRVEDDEVVASPAGQAVLDTWHALRARFPMVVLDAIVTMPNHVHAIFGIVSHHDITTDDATQGRGAACCAQNDQVGTAGAASSGPTRRAPDGPAGTAGAASSASTRRASDDQVGTAGAASSAPTRRAPDDPAGTAGAASSTPTVGQVMRAWKSLSAAGVNATLGRSGSVWQRNYFEHIIRDDESLNRIRQYIADNPERWAFDRENPDCVPEARHEGEHGG